MKIVFVLTEIAVGGAERVVLDLCTELQSRNIKTAVIALKAVNCNDIMVKNFQKQNIKLYSLNVDKKHPFKVLELKKYITAIAPDVVSAHLFHPNILCRLLLKKRNFRLINTIHIMEIRKFKQWRFFIDKLTFKMADCHTAVSVAAANFQEEKLHIPKGSIKIIRNGIKMPHLLNDEEISNLRKKWNVENCDIVLGCVGRLNHQKGFDILLNMKSAIIEKFSNKKLGLVFIGDGPEKENLQELADNAPENMQIVFAGYSDNAASECGAFDVFLMPSRFEGLPLSLIEATAHGIPIVAQNIPSVSEVLTHYPNAILTDFERTPYVASQNIADALKLKRFLTPHVPTVEKMTDKYLDIFSGKI